jgi:23S rRNA pseudouridine1911/1915/1917 synthase
MTAALSIQTQIAEAFAASAPELATKGVSILCEDALDIATTAANALAFRYKKEGVPFIFRPVNRLDRNTSGLLLVAKNRMAAARLFEAMKTGKIKKDYLAILDGVPNDTVGEIRTHIKRTDESIIVRRVCREDEGGDLAVTKYRVLAADAERNHAIVLASPITGRTHQLRVHFAHIGCPITGDDMYGRPSDIINRHALHAFRLSFPHPKNGERVDVISHLPRDMRELAILFFAKEDLLSVQSKLVNDSCKASEENFQPDIT